MFVLNQLHNIQRFSYSECLYVITYNMKDLVTSMLNVWRSEQGYRWVWLRLMLEGVDKAKVGQYG